MPQLHDACAAVPARRDLRRTFVVLLAAALVCAVALSGCSSGGSAGSTPAAGKTNAGTAAAGSPGAAGKQTPIVTGTIDLQTDAGAAQAYVIKLPPDWQAENIPTPGGFGRRYTFFDQGNRVAQVTVKCQGGGTIDELQRQDNAVVGTLKGVYGAGGIQDVTLGGMPGKRTGYTLPVGGTQQETRVIYLQGKICAWQILEQTFGAGQLARYQPLFDAIMATFEPTSPGG